MSIFNSPLSDNYLSRLIFDEIELKNNVNQYINRMKISEWSNNFNRIFISPGNSFNTKYFIKVPIIKTKYRFSIIRYNLLKYVDNVTC